MLYRAVFQQVAEGEQAMTIKIDSEKFYLFVQGTLAEIEQTCNNAGMKSHPQITIWGGAFASRGSARAPGDFYLQISSGYSLAGDEIKVQGKDIAAVTEEFLRRTRFEQEQHQLKLGKPVIDQVEGA